MSLSIKIPIPFFIPAHRLLTWITILFHSCAVAIEEKLGWRNYIFTRLATHFGIVGARCLDHSFGVIGSHGGFNSHISVQVIIP